MARLTDQDLARVTARTALLQATWNYERQQGLGWAFCLQPVLERLYPDARERLERLAAHTAYFNTQPTLASLALGAAAAVEEQRAAALLAPAAPAPLLPPEAEAREGAPVEPVPPAPTAETVRRVQSVLGSALAALGDRLFWGTLRPLVTCIGVLVALTASWMGAIAFWIAYNLFHLGLRSRGVAWGYREGPAVLGPALRGRLESLTSGLAALGAILVGVIVAELLVPHGTPDRITSQMTLSGGLVFGLITSQRPRPSPTQWALGLGVLCAIAGWWG